MSLFWSAIAACRSGRLYTTVISAGNSRTLCCAPAPNPPGYVFPGAGASRCDRGGGASPCCVGFSDDSPASDGPTRRSSGKGASEMRGLGWDQNDPWTGLHGVPSDFDSAVLGECACRMCREACTVSYAVCCQRPVSVCLNGTPTPMGLKSLPILLAQRGQTELGQVQYTG